MRYAATGARQKHLLRRDKPMRLGAAMVKKVLALKNCQQCPNVKPSLHNW